MTLRIRLILVLISLFVCIQARAADEFYGIKCGTDISKMMVGKHSSNERVVVLEKRHSDLGLEDLGGIEVSDQLFLISWRICGSEYAELINTKKNIVRDVLQIPKHSLRLPLSFAERCQVGNKDIHDAVIAVLENSQGEKPAGYTKQIMLPAKIAWKIDERQERFFTMPIEHLSCAVSGSSADVSP